MFLPGEGPCNPHKVTHMKEAFSGAMQLAGEVTIPETVEDMRACFDGTVQPLPCYTPPAAGRRRSIWSLRM